MVNGAIILTVRILRSETQYLIEFITSPCWREEMFMLGNFRLTFEEIQNIS